MLITPEFYIIFPIENFYQKLITCYLNMRTITAFIFYIFLTSFVLVNCGQTSKRTRKPVTSIQVTPKNKKHTVGDKLTVHFQTRLKEGSLKKTEIFLDGKSVFTSDKAENSFEIVTGDLSLGTHFIKAVATTGDDITGENFSEFLLLSDIVPRKFGYKVIKAYPHPNEGFTQGLEIKDGYLYEGTGQEGSSAIYKTDLSNWKVIQEYKLEDQYFGEGITILNDKLYQLTYKSKIGFVRDLKTFETIRTWNFKNNEGWGLTNDGKNLIMSDGTEYLTYLDPETFNEIKRIQVCSNAGVVKNINEMEYINGEIWANIWTTNLLIRIDPKTGKIIAEIDLKGLLTSGVNSKKEQVDVLNGIAWDPRTKKLYVTGKLWPKIFEIEPVEK